MSSHLPPHPVASTASHSAAERSRAPKNKLTRPAAPGWRPVAGPPAQPAAILNPPSPANNHTGLPDSLKTGVESLSGQSLDHVRVHRNSAKPAQLNAHAYAQGGEIHVAPGQEKHLPHEAWHVVQQAQGRVKATTQLKEQGVPINDAPHLEREAEANGRKAQALGAAEVAAPRLARGPGASRPRAAPDESSRNPVQRYLIVANNDYTDAVNVQHAALAGVTAGVLNQIVTAMGPPALAAGAGSLEETMLHFLQADAGGVVTRQLGKWIEDRQGQMGPNSHPDFGRKHQARVYNNFIDLGQALYGWVTSKAGRREEKHLATQVQASPLVDAYLDSVLTRLHVWVNDPARPAGMVAILSANNPARAVAPWADYRNWFNHDNMFHARLQLPGNFMTVLANPANYPQRVKVAVLHDVMNYIVSIGHLGPLPASTATTLAGRAAYVRPQTSNIDRDSVARAPVADVAAARALQALHPHQGVRSSTEETHASYIYARTHRIPMWARHSYTAARMLAFTNQVGGTAPEMRAVADSTMAFWRKDFDHRSKFAYHTLHEIQDFTPDFGLGAYNPLTRYDDLHARLDVMAPLMVRLAAVAASVNWNTRAYRLRGPNVIPASIVAIRAELATAHSNVMKLIAIKNEIHDKVGVSLTRDTVTKNFYIILNRIPDNLHLYTGGATSRAVRSGIAVQLSRVLRELTAFVP